MNIQEKNKRVKALGKEIQTLKSLGLKTRFMLNNDLTLKITELSGHSLFGGLMKKLGYQSSKALVNFHQDLAWIKKYGYFSAGVGRVYLDCAELELLSLLCDIQKTLTDDGTNTLILLKD